MRCGGDRVSLSNRPTVHTLKTWPGPFQEVWLGLKPFELRYDDRSFHVGDVLRLEEFHPHVGLTGRAIGGIEITCILAGQFGIQPGHCVLGFAPVVAAQRIGEGA